MMNLKHFHVTMLLLHQILTALLCLISIFIPTFTHFLRKDDASEHHDGSCLFLGYFYNVSEYSARRSFLQACFLKHFG